EEEFTKTYLNADSIFTDRDLQWELTELKKQFNPTGYFKKTRQPADELLEDWVKRKFAEYAVQGKWIYDYRPNTLLIQNETPTDLRSAMYQPLINSKYGNYLPLVYFSGINNEEYF
ncbi:MAG: hypothetical protein NUV82_00760, partial [Candidatus Komeilibacteria bacterium]|nr:hypothetical protein [Candidatus Komeilibacteria bacterium]